MLIELTPTHLRCSFGACPAVYKKEDGTFVIVGKKTDPGIETALSGKVGEDEYVVEIKAEFLTDILPLKQPLLTYSCCERLTNESSEAL